MRSRERPIARERVLARAGALQHAPQLAPERDPEVERRPDALGGHRQAMARGVAGEEHAVLDGRTQPVRDPVALVAVRRQPEIAGERHSRLPDAVVRVERADAHPQLAGRRERPAVARADHALVDPQLEVLAGAAGMDLQPAREARVRRLDQRLAQHPLPPERVDDQGGRDVAAVGVHHVPRPAVDLGGLEPGSFAALLPQQAAERAVVERGERPAERPARGRARGVDEQGAERLPDRPLEAQAAQPLGRRRARGGLALPDLVAVEDQHARAGGAQLARDRQPGERRAADQDVELAGERCALGAALGGSDGHRKAGIIGNAARILVPEAARVIRCLWKPL